MPVSSGAVALLAFLLDARPAAVRRLAPAPADLRAVADMLRTYAEARWETTLRAPGVAGRLRSVAAEPRGVGRPAAGPRT